MPSPALPETESPYREFTQNPAEDDDDDGRGHRPGVPMTMTDRDGSILYETEDLLLLDAIICQDDANALEKYVTVAPWAIPKLHSLPDDDKTLFDSSLTLLTALERGSLGIVRIILFHELKHCDSTQRIRSERFGFQLLNEAARWGHIEMVQFFLDNQPLYASIHDRDRKGGTAIISAADIYSDRYVRRPEWNQVRPDKNEAIMNMLLDHGACASGVVLPMNDMEKTPNTVLTLAAQWSSPKMIKRLIESGAVIHTKVTQDPWDLGFQDRPEEISAITALFIACLHANFKAAKTLIDCRGINIDLIDILRSRDSRGSLPIHWATRNRLPDELEHIPSMLQETVRSITSTIGLLLDCDPTTVNIQDNDGNTPLHYATRYLSQRGKEYTPILEFVCNRGADASMRNHKRETPLHTLFIRAPSVEVDPAAVSILLSYGAKATDVDDAGNTPLHLAAANFLQLDVVSLLLDRGADASTRNAKQETPLHIASYGRCTNGRSMGLNESIKAHDDMLERLVEASGVELLDLPNAEGKSPREICQEKRNEWTRNRNSSRGGRGRGRGRGR